jgi:hypothetical protein
LGGIAQGHLSAADLLPIEIMERTAGRHHDCIVQRQYLRERPSYE